MIIVCLIVHALEIFRPSFIGCKCFNKSIPRENFGIKDNLDINIGTFS